MAIAGIVASFVLLINKTGSVINAFKYMGNSIVMVFEGIANAFNFMLNGIVSAINLIPGVSVPLIPKVVLPKFSFTSPGSGSVSGSSGITAGPDLLERSLIKAIPAGGPAVSVATPSAPRGGGGSAATGGAAAAGRGGGTPYNDFAGIGVDPSFSGDLFNLGSQRQRQLPDTINITINAAVAEASLGQTIVDALTDYNRRSGPLDLQIAV